MKVSDLTKIPILKDLKLVAGKSGLENPIRSVNIMDNPLALDWLSAGEILLTSGYFFRENKEQQNQFLIGLHNIGCPCLCIKPKQFLSNIPDNMVQIADVIGLPIFEIPYGLSFSKILVAVMNELGEKYDPISKRSVEIHNDFFEIALNGGGLNSLGTKLANLVGNPIAFLDENWKLMHFCDFFDQRSFLEQVFSLKIGQKFFPNSFLENLPYEVGEFQKPITRELEANGTVMNCRIMPAVAVNRNYGYIVLIQTVRPISEIDFIAMENASLVFSMERIHLKELDDVKANLRGDFFDDLLTGKFQSLDEVKDQCNILGLNPLHNYCCLVVVLEASFIQKSDNVVHTQFLFNQQVQQLIDTIYEIAYAQKRNVFCFHRRGNIVVIESRNTKQSAFSDENLFSFADAIGNEISRKIDISKFKIGIGRPCSTILNLKQSFRGACESVRISEKLQLKQLVIRYSDFEVYHLLEENIHQELLEEFFFHTLGELYNYDKENNTAFMKTLESYINCNYNAAEAAKSIYIHRNTFFYRMEKIRLILKSDLTKAEDLFKYNLALKILKLLPWS